MEHERPYSECTLEVISPQGDRTVALSVELDPGGRVVRLTEPEVDTPDTDPMEEWCSRKADDDATYYALFFARLAAALVKMPMPRDHGPAITEDQRIEWTINATELDGEVDQPLCALVITSQGQVHRIDGLEGVARLHGVESAHKLPWPTWVRQARMEQGQNSIRFALALVAATLPSDTEK